MEVQAKVAVASSTVKLWFECAQMSENNILECRLSLLGILEIDWTYGMTRTSGMNSGQPDDARHSRCHLANVDFLFCPI